MREAMAMDRDKQPFHLGRLMRRGLEVGVQVVCALVVFLFVAVGVFILFMGSKENAETVREYGRWAAKEGLPVTANPYRDHLGHHWNSGWAETKAVMSGRAPISDEGNP
jgi:hypothetical protein